jgi:hypothetical protein
MATMATWRTVLQQKHDSISAAWQGAALDAYPADAARFFARERDAFCNPVGQTFAAALGAVLAQLAVDFDVAKLRLHLTPLVKIRAVQEMPASQALAFIFALKPIVRTALGPAHDADGQRELLQFEAEVDRLALCAFDIYAECLAAVCALRVDEAKRQVAGVLRRLQRSDGAPRALACQGATGDTDDAATGANG